MIGSHIKYALLLSQVFLCVVLLAFYHYSWSDFSFGAFSGLVVLIGLGAFYRPRWAFWFFVGLLPFEALSLTENILPISLRPYQIVGGALFVAVSLNLLIGRTNLRLPRPRMIDGFVLLIPLGGLIGALSASNMQASIGLWVIVCSFVGLYMITRVFVTKLTHLRMPLKFLGTSALIVSLYGVLQNYTFVTKEITTAVMPGRPNATFSEADWFGMFLAFGIAVCMSLLVYFVTVSNREPSRKILRHYIAVITSVQGLFFVVLILSVARSAWLGVVTVIFVAVIVVSWYKDFRLLKGFGALLVSSFVVAFILVTLTDLSRFDLGNRAQSTSSGLQEITVACVPSAACTQSVCTVPAIVNSISELDVVGCSFINLEDIEAEREAGNIVTTTTRPDPNVEIRKQIFAQSWAQIMEHPFVGIGWGSISDVLGTDESGTSLNSSNLFLQVWLGSGLLGLIGLMGIIFILLRASLQSVALINNEKATHRQLGILAYSLFIILGGVAIIVPNLFNAGLLTGFIWVYLGCTQIIFKKK